MSGQQRLEAAAARLVGAVVRRLPRRLVLGLGRGLGRLLAFVDRRHVRITVCNLRLSFPEWTEAQTLRIARRVYAHFGAVLLDLLWMEGRSGEELARIVEVEGRENCEAASAAGKGVLYCTAHLGNWEINAIAHSILLCKLAVVARALDNPALDARLLALRSAFGNEVLYKRRALGEVIRRLRSGGSAAILLDQNVQERDGIFISFFGRPAATTTVAAAVALKTGCALVPGYTRLLPDGRYRLVYEPALRVDAGAERGAEIRRLTQAIADRTEAWIREQPEQWLWMHRRWKTQPSAISLQPSAVSTQPSALSDQPSANRDGKL